MLWRGLLDKMIKDVRNTFGQSVVYTRSDNQQSFHITAIYSIRYSESEAGGRISTTIERKELDICINDIGGVAPKSNDSVVVIATENNEAQEHFTVVNVQASESGMYKLILRNINDDAPKRNG
ncbi:hypothetical protein BAnh1_09590 [Bartonella australis AUST/NH1]|uniref:Phage related protein n=1 Tax=Bartonella australis (strain Aust/NH1) TaxID=1094489 RepID=M1PDZ8_BARAA|nr:hypothetical protein [Bartonella australis]AGF74831.1 hypothetical protein BAnh1_09590 [Bartonella australis AUST/NH1]